MSDPFSPDNAPGAILIVAMRIYDVLMALTAHVDPEMAKALEKAHEEGKVIGPLPSFDMGTGPDKV